MLKTMEVKVVATASKAKDVYDYEITLDGDVVGTCQIRKALSKSDSIPSGFENNIFFALFPGYEDLKVLAGMFKAMQVEAEKLEVAELIGILSAEETVPAHALELLGAEISDAAPTLDGHLIRKFVLPQVHHHDAGKTDERRAGI